MHLATLHPIPQHQSCQDNALLTLHTYLLSSYSTISSFATFHAGLTVMSASTHPGVSSLDSHLCNVPRLPTSTLPGSTSHEPESSLPSLPIEQSKIAPACRQQARAPLMHPSLLIPLLLSSLFYFTNFVTTNHIPHNSPPPGLISHCITRKRFQ